ncbi:MAG: hypothetical protein KIT22_03305, partial [Verrucomicrobiae bacterium]|nr:hypothetical protein [Verrucomicrobiae bacterium]
IWPAGVSTAMQALRERGEISPVIATDEGFYLLKLVDWRRGDLPRFEQVRDRLQQEMTRERALAAEAEIYSRLRAAFPVQVHQQVLDEGLRTATAFRPPPPLPMK